MNASLLPSATFCALPFGHFFLSEEGKSYPCCYALETGAVNQDDEGREIRVRSSADIGTAWNSPTQRKLRRQLVAGEAPTACQRCSDFETHGLLSLRQVANHDFANEIAPALAAMDAEGAMPVRFFSVDLRLGNLCNLRCQMCSPVSSRKMVHDLTKIYPAAEADFQRMAAIDWHKDPALLAAILGSTGGLRELHFAGGEPFLIPEVFALVARLAEQPRAREIRLSFNSNGTHLPENLLALFPKFRGVRLLLSCDGPSKVNDYIRFPSRYDQLTKNFQRVHQNLGNWNIIQACFNVTVQMHNIFHLPAFLAHLAQAYPKFFPFPVLSPLRFPECLSVRVLPASLKAEVRGQLEAFVLQNRASWQTRLVPAGERNGNTFEKEIYGLLNFMDAADRSDLLPEFHRFTGVIEEIRGQKLKVPGL